MKIKYFPVAMYHHDCDLLYRTYQIYEDKNCFVAIYLDTNGTFKPTLTGRLDVLVRTPTGDPCFNKSDSVMRLVEIASNLIDRENIKYLSQRIEYDLRMIETDQIVNCELALNVLEALIMIQDDIEKGIPMHIVPEVV